MKKFLSFLLAVLMCLPIALSIGCAGGADKPVVTIKEYVATWEPQKKATEYVLDIDGVEKTVKSTVTSQKLGIGQTIKVKSVQVKSSGERIESEWSEPVVCWAEGHTFEKFNAVATPAFKLPGCEMLINPQSLDVSEEMGLVFVAGYLFNHKNQQEPTLWVLDLETGKLLGTYIIYDTDGSSRHYSYVGGLAVTEKNLFISSQQRLYRISLSKFAVPADGAVVIDEEIQVHAGAAHCCYVDGILWVGDFVTIDNKENYKVPKDRPVPGNYVKYNSKGEPYEVKHTNPQSWTVGYVLEDTDREIKVDSYQKVTPDYVILIGDRIRGLTFQNGYMILTQSYAGAATLLFKKLSLTDTPADTTVKINGVDLPVWDVYNNPHSYSINTMKDPLQISNLNNDLILVFGSGSKYYSDTFENALKDKATEFAWKLKFPTIA